MLLAQMHRPQEAAVHYRTAVAGWPDNAELRLNFALALLDTGDNERALEQLDTAAGLRAGDPVAYLITGKLLLQQSRPADAWKVYERALAIEPKQLDALMGSAVALTQLRRPEEATEKYRLALEADPRNVDAHVGLGSTLLENGRLAEAKQEFARALSLNPGDKDARRSLERTDQLLLGKHR
jgi:Flp pilus assembly protein TadD